MSLAARKITIELPGIANKALRMRRAKEYMTHVMTEKKFDLGRDLSRRLADLVGNSVAGAEEGPEPQIADEGPEPAPKKAKTS